VSLIIERWIPPDRGALFVVTGASGTGKTTLLRAALDIVPGIAFSVSATTRAIRAGEMDGVDYHFLRAEQFEAQVQAGAFLEWAEVYGHRYGTLRGPVEEALKGGQSVLLDIDTQGADQVRTVMPEAVSLFVLPPSLEALGTRLRARGTDSEAIIEGRLRSAQDQIQECGHFDYLVVNDHLQSAQDQFAAILVAELRKTSRQPSLVARFVLDQKHTV
jgi:guanylate kinase